jgi:predicted dehydrogenase
VGERIRVGVIGASATRGFASLSHLPALRQLPNYELVAVCASSDASAAAAARHYDVRRAYSDAQQLARDPEVDLVTVSVKVPDHLPAVMAAIDAGKHVYCEWPLGRNTGEAVAMRDAATRSNVRNVVGLQGQVAPAINYVKHLIAEGYVGRVLAVSMLGSAPSWGPTVESRYQAEMASGANILTITCGHQLDALCYCLGEFREVSATLVNQRPRIGVGHTGDEVAKDTPDQIAVNGVIGDDVAVSFQMRAGPARGTEFLFEIHGTEGDLIVTPSTSRASMQRQELAIQGGRLGDKTTQAMMIPEHFRWVPRSVPEGSAYNVAQLYVKLAESIRAGTDATPDFAAAVTRHRMLDAIVESANTGQRRTL